MTDFRKMALEFSKNNIEFSAEEYGGNIQYIETEFFTYRFNNGALVETSINPIWL